MHSVTALRVVETHKNEQRFPQRFRWRARVYVVAGWHEAELLQTKLYRYRWQARLLRAWCGIQNLGPGYYFTVIDTVRTPRSGLGGLAGRTWGLWSANVGGPSKKTPRGGIPSGRSDRPHLSHLTKR